MGLCRGAGSALLVHHLPSSSSPRPPPPFSHCCLPHPGLGGSGRAPGASLAPLKGTQAWLSPRTTSRGCGGPPATTAAEPRALSPPPGTTGATAAGLSSALPARVAAALSRNRLLPKQLGGMQEGSCHLRVASGLPRTLWVLPSPGGVTPRCGGCGGGRALSPRQGLSQPHVVPFCLPVPHHPSFRVPPCSWGGSRGTQGSPLPGLELSQPPHPGAVSSHAGRRRGTTTQMSA